jgi:hypothetical protein
MTVEVYVYEPSTLRCGYCEPWIVCMVVGYSWGVAQHPSPDEPATTHENHVDTKWRDIERMRELTVIRPGPSSNTDRKRVKLRTAKGSNHGPQKGQTTDRKRVKLRTAKGSPRTERSQHGPKRPQDHEHEPSSSSRLPYRSCGATYARHFVLRQRQHEPFTITTFDFLAYVSCCADTYPTLRWHDTRGYPTLNLETC